MTCTWDSEPAIWRQIISEMWHYDWHRQHDSHDSNFELHHDFPWLQEQEYYLWSTSQTDEHL
ncbi:hypothetical protein HanRHA438_Chr09g0412721 [Helianthus annuus]|nr:hypothetical protein HanRHA438_Chr09g0412721 [Helianthus annuus]